MTAERRAYVLYEHMPGFFFLLADMPPPGMGIHTRTYRHTLDVRYTWYPRSHSRRFIFLMYINNATVPVPSALGPVRHCRYRSYVHVAGHNVLLYVPTTLCQCTKRRSTVRDFGPVQVSWPAPTRRPSARPSP